MNQFDKGLRPVAGYVFESTVELSKDGASPARTVIRGTASLAKVDDETNRIHFDSIEVVQTDGIETHVVDLSPLHQAALRESFDVVNAEESAIVVGASEPEEITNIKRTVVTSQVVGVGSQAPVGVKRSRRWWWMFWCCLRLVEM